MYEYLAGLHFKLFSNFIASTCVCIIGIAIPIVSILNNVQDESILVIGILVEMMGLYLFALSALNKMVIDSHKRGSNKEIL